MRKITTVSFASILLLTLANCGGGGSGARPANSGPGSDPNVEPLLGDRWQIDSYRGRTVDTTTRDGLWVMVGNETRTVRGFGEVVTGDYERRMTFVIRTVDGQKQIRLCGQTHNNWWLLDDVGDLDFVNGGNSIQYSFTDINLDNPQAAGTITGRMAIDYGESLNDPEDGTSRDADGEYIAWKVSDATLANLGTLDIYAERFSISGPTVVVPFLDKQVNVACLNEEKGPVLSVGPEPEDFISELAKQGIDSIHHTEDLLVSWDTGLDFGQVMLREVFVAENSPSENNGFFTMVNEKSNFNLWISGADNTDYAFSKNVASQSFADFTAEYPYEKSGEKTQSNGSLRINF